MPWHLALLVFVTVFHTPVRVSGVELSVSPSSLNEGDTLAITCREQSLQQGSGLLRLGLKKINDAGIYDNFIYYDVNLGQGDPYLQRWGDTVVGSELQQRANFTSSFDPNKMYGSFEVRIHSVRCSDPASFRCERTAQGTAGTQTTSVQNVTISGVTQNVQVTGAQDCSMFTDPDCDKCQSFDGSSGVQPRYARMGEAVELTCAGQMATPQSQNKAIWYKQTVNDLQKAMITVNTSDLTYDPPSPNACTVYGRSTLTYYPQDTDRELRISCEISSPNSPDIVGDEMSICVQGLIVTSTVVSTPNPGPSQGGLGGGPIAGIVIGIIALIVLVVVLVYFLWYRRRDSGESYNTREADGRSQPPPVAKKPEMHENSTYDTTGDNQDNNYYSRNDRYNQGKVNRGMDDDYYHHDNDTTPRSRDPIGSSV